MRILVCVMLCACSGSGGSDPTPDLAMLFPAPCEVTACGAAVQITTAAELRAAITAAPHAEMDPTSEGCRPASVDLKIVGTITLEAASPESEFDDDQSFEIHGVRYGNPAGDVVGVTCTRTGLHDSDCELITFTDTTIRVRAYTRDLHPDGGYLDVIEVLNACEQPCGADEFRCAATNTCWTTERDYCKYCLGGTVEACGCYADDEQAPDGEACTYPLGTDVWTGGTCQTGTCVEG